MGQLGELKIDCHLRFHLRFRNSFVRFHHKLFFYYFRKIFDVVSNLRNRTLTNHKQELRTKNYQ